MNVSSMNAPAAVNRDTPVEAPSPEKTTTTVNEDRKAKSKSKSTKDKTKSKSSKSKTAPKESETKPKDKETPIDLKASSDADVKIKKSSKSKNDSLTSSSEPVADVEDEEVRLAMEMAIAAAKNPHLAPAQIRELVGERNKQAQIIEEVERKKKEELERKKQEELDEAQKRWDEKRENAINWWQAKSLAVKETAAQLSEAALKKAEEMKNGAEMRLYAEQIKKDPEHIELRKKIKVLRKVYKAHKLNGNRIETRHVFKRQRMEKKLILICDKLSKTQRLFTHSSYNVQEYLKALMKASKKWRKKGTDEEMMLEAQLCRNMHQMLALEKQKVQCKKSQREMKKYLQRCKGWLMDKKAFCEMNQMTLDATMNSMKILYEDIIARQDELIARLKASDEFRGVDLSDVDISHIKLPTLPSETPAAQRVAAVSDAMKGLLMNDSIRIKKEASVKSGQNNTSSSNLKVNRPELYVTTKDDASVSSCLSDPDEPMNVVCHKGQHKYISDEESDCHFNFGSDAPWMTSGSSLRSSCSKSMASAIDRKSLSNGSSQESSFPKNRLPPDSIEEEDEIDASNKPKSKILLPPGKNEKRGSDRSKPKQAEAGSDSLLRATPDTSESAESLR